MKKQLLSLILSGLFLIILPLVAQNTDYPTQKINGVEYYIYTVQPQEGMYAISRKFGIKQADINNANPAIEDGLKAGQQVFIPVANSKKPPEKPSIKKVVDKGFIQHKVEKKQTLFAISRKYNVSQDEIKKYNPEIENGLREGLILQIPTPEKVIENKEKENADILKRAPNSKQLPSPEKKSFIIHIVQANETLYSISNKYNVRVAEIIELNPGSASQVNIGGELKIPSNDRSTKKNDLKKENVYTNKSQETNRNKTESIIPSENIKHIKIGFLLPFMIDQDKNDAGNERFLDFYGGALIAIQEAKRKGISLEIFTYDTEKSEEKLIDVLNIQELKTMDLIIGPAFSNQISLIGEFAKENKINTVIPFSSKVSDIENNPYLFQFNPGIDATLKFTSELLTGKMKNLHLIFAEIPGVSSFDEGKMLYDGLKENLLKSRKTFSEIKLSTSVDADFTKGLKKGDRNLIIFNTDKFAYVSPFISPLKENARDYNIVMLEQYSWLTQTNKLPENIYISPFISNLNLNELNTFNEKFSKSFNRDASRDLPRFDLLGYDLTSYFIYSINRYGSKFTEKMGSSNNSSWIQSQPLFERVSNGSGFINKRLYLSEDNLEE